MEERFVMVNIEDEEQSGLSYEDTSEEIGKIDVRWCLVEKFLT